MILRFRHTGLERLNSRDDTSGVSAQHVKRLPRAQRQGTNQMADIIELPYVEHVTVLWFDGESAELQFTSGEKVYKMKFPLRKYSGLKTGLFLCAAAWHLCLPRERISSQNNQLADVPHVSKFDPTSTVPEKRLRKHNRLRHRF